MRLGRAAASIAGCTVVRRVGSVFKSGEERQDAPKALVGQADNLVKTTGEMKGAAMKLGQMLSVSPDAVPSEFSEKIKS